MAGEFGITMPEEAQMLIDHYSQKCLRRGWIQISFSVDGLPMSLNHQYDETLVFCSKDDPGAFQDKRGRWRRRGKSLKPQALEWRRILLETLGAKRWSWKPTGITAAVLLFQSPRWLTARRMVRQEDADNKVKPAFDAIESATTIPDELHWQFHVFKVLSKRARTTIFLFDLGDIVEYHY